MTTYTDEVNVYNPEAIASGIADAEKTATSYLSTVDQTGLMVHPSSDSTSGWKISSAIELLKSGISYIKMWLEGSPEVANLRLGLEDGNNLLIDQSSFSLRNGSEKLMSLTQSTRDTSANFKAFDPNGTNPSGNDVTSMSMSPGFTTSVNGNLRTYSSHAYIDVCQENSYCTGGSKLEFFLRDQLNHGIEFDIDSSSKPISSVKSGAYRDFDTTQSMCLAGWISSDTVFLHPSLDVYTGGQRIINTLENGNAKYSGNASEIGILDGLGNFSSKLSVDWSGKVLLANNTQLWDNTGAVTHLLTPVNASNKQAEFTFEPDGNIYRRTSTDSGSNWTGWQAIGAVKTTDISSATSIATSTYKSIGSISLEAGTWVIAYGGQFASNSTGVRAAFMYTSQNVAASAVWNRESLVQSAATPSGQTYLRGTCIVSPTSTTTYYLTLWHNAGSAINCYGNIKAIRIG